MSRRLPRGSIGRATFIFSKSPIRTQNDICVNPSPLRPSTFPVISSRAEQEDINTSTTLFDFSSNILLTNICPEVRMSTNIIIMKIYAVKNTWPNPDSSSLPAFVSLIVFMSIGLVRFLTILGSTPSAVSFFSTIRSRNAPLMFSVTRILPIFTERYSTTESVITEFPTIRYPSIDSARTRESAILLFIPRSGD